MFGINSNNHQVMSPLGSFGSAFNQQTFIQIPTLSGENYIVWRRKIEDLLRMKNLFKHLEFETYTEYFKSIDKYRIKVRINMEEKIRKIKDKMEADLAQKFKESSDEKLIDIKEEANEEIKKLEKELNAKMESWQNEDDQQETPWIISDNLTRNTIIVYISEKYQEDCRKFLTSKSLMAFLEKKFNPKQHNLIVTLKGQFNRTNQLPSESLIQFLERLEIIGKQLSDLGSPVHENEFCYHYYGNLTESYQMFGQNLCSQEILTIDQLRIKARAEDQRSKSNKFNNNKNEKAYFNQSHNQGTRNQSNNSNNNNSNNNSNNNKNNNNNNNNKYNNVHIKCKTCGKLLKAKSKFKYCKSCYDNYKNQKKNFANNTEEFQIEGTFCSNELVNSSNDGNSSILDSNWYLDSACTTHLTNCKEDMVNIKKDLRIFEGPFNEKSSSHESGDQTIKLINENNEISQINLKNICFSKVNRRKLISLYQLAKDGYKFEIDSDKIFIKKFDKPIGQGKINHTGLYALEEYIDSINKAEELSALEWHNRLGHISEQKLKELVKNNAADNIKIKGGMTFTCKICDLANMKRKKFKIRNRNSTEVGEIIHSDLSGRFSTKSLGGAEYYIILIDDYSGYVWSQTLKEKSSAFKYFKQFQQWLETQFKKKIKKFVTDGGGEYTSNEFEEYLKDCGIEHEITPPHTPQQNGKSENFNRTIMRKIRAQLKAKNLPNYFWGESLIYSTYLHNRTIKKNSTKTPYEILFNKKPDLKYVRTFGCPVTFANTDPHKKKLENRGKSGIFLGISDTGNTCRIFDVNNRKIAFSRDVKYYENEYYYKSKVLSNDEISHDLERENEDEYFEDKNEECEQPYEHFIQDSPFQHEQFFNKENQHSTHNEDSQPLSLNKPECQIPIPEELIIKSRNEEPQTSTLSQPSSNQKSKISTSTSQSNLNQSNISHISQRTRSKLDLSKLVQEVEYACVLEDTADKDTPKTYDEAIRNQHWIDAIAEELNNLEVMNTWNIIEKPGRDINTIKSKWVFKIKRDSTGKIVRYKARLVAKGYSQKYGIDYFETFSPVLRYDSLRFLLNYANDQKLEIEQMDVEAAFLNGELTEEIYMEIPQGVKPVKSNSVLKLNKSIYGLKQAARNWNKKFKDVILSHGYIQSTADDCIFYKLPKNKCESISIIAIFVDDSIIIGNKLANQSVKDMLNSNFKMKDLGNAEYVLGIKVEREEGNIYLSQTSYIESMLKEFNMENSKAYPTPMSINFHKSTDNSKVLESNEKYMSAIGKLIYLSNSTRPDIAYSVSFLARKVQSPTENDWSEVKRIFRYLKGTINKKLRYHSGNTNVDIYSDASYAENIEDRKSTSGNLFIMNGGAIAWKSKKQNTVSLSSMEAELISLAEAVKHGLWLRKLENELMLGNYEFNVFVDNQSTIKFATTKVMNNRSKHIDVRYNFIKEKIEEGTIKIIYCPTENQTADVFTKPLSEVKFLKFSNDLGVSTCSKLQAANKL
jgi:hypothetical protein